MIRYILTWVVLLVVAVYLAARFDKLKAPAMKLLTSSDLSAEDQRQLFFCAGYDEVQVIEEKKKGWICAMGTRSQTNGMQ
jgi:hypothetical protein